MSIFPGGTVNVELRELTPKAGSCPTNFTRLASRTPQI